jgi:hypothetical protein
MPTYHFRNKKTGKVIEMTMSIAEAEEYEKANPHMNWQCAAPKIVDAHKVGRMKPDSEFRDRLKDIKKSHRGSKINTF